MSLADTIQQAVITAMKAKDQETLSTLRMLTAAIKNAQIDAEKDLTDEDVQGVVSKQVKQLKDSLEQFRVGGREDLAGGVEKEINTLEVYLPEQLSEEEVEKIVQEVIGATGATSVKDMGRVMGQVMGKAKGQVDGNVVKNIAQKLLS